MAKRKLKRSQITLAGPNGPVTHDRRASDLSRQAETVEAQVDDPYEAGAKIIVMRNLRDDPLARLRARGQIDEGQYLGGRHWQQEYEIAELGAAKAIDTTKEAVDGGQIAQDGLTERQQKAFRALALASIKLGLEGEALMMDFLVHGRGIKEIAARRGCDTEPELKYFGRRIRECLETLAIAFRYVSPAVNSGENKPNTLAGLVQQT